MISTSRSGRRFRSVSSGEPERFASTPDQRLERSGRRAVTVLPGRYSGIHLDGHMTHVPAKFARARSGAALALHAPDGEHTVPARADRRRRDHHTSRGCRNCPAAASIAPLRFSIRAIAIANRVARLAGNRRARFHQRTCSSRVPGRCCGIRALRCRPWPRWVHFWRRCCRAVPVCVSRARSAW